MPIYIDQMKREVIINTPPQRIVSLVPSQTELLFDLGLDNEVVGITKFCVHPNHWLKHKTIIGGTKSVNIKKIETLYPDLIIGNKEENKQEDIEFLMHKYPVWMSDISTLEEAMQMIKLIAQISHTEKKGHELLQTIESKFNNIGAILKAKRVAYFIWNKPMMVAGKQTFIDAILKKLGAINVFQSIDQTTQSSYRYPQVSAEELSLADPEIIFLSSEPFPFKEKHIQQFKQICPLAKITIVDGEMFSWYGSRMQLAPDYFKQTLGT
jgi:ABC-type Fe3+-hydroxamate transport system substrate-binding protein